MGTGSMLLVLTAYVGDDRIKGLFYTVEWCEFRLWRFDLG